MKTIIFITLFAFTQLSCNRMICNQEECTNEINLLLNNWHFKAANADITYFDDIAETGIYIGTAKEEVWTKNEFLTFAKPYFDKGKAWDFKPYNRNIFSNKAGNVAWFNEQLNTWMGVCRGSGVLQKQNGEWKIYQYTLSVAVPNNKINEVVSIIEQN